MYIIKYAISVFASVLNILIFIRCIISWLPIRRNGPVMQLLYALTEPILGPIRSIIDKSPIGGPGMMLDFSPVIALLLINAASQFIISIL